VPPFGPIKRKDLIGPYPAGKHEYLVRGTHRVHIPNPHEGEISKNLLNRLLKQAGVSREDWEML
jgi:hypothetical protein